MSEENENSAGSDENPSGTASNVEDKDQAPLPPPIKKRKKKFNPRSAKIIFSAKDLHWNTGKREFSGVSLDIRAGEKFALMGWDPVAQYSLLSIFPEISLFP